MGRTKRQNQLLTSGLFAVAVGLLAIKNPDLADAAIQLLPAMFGVEIVPPTGTIPDFGTLAQMEGWKGFVGTAGIAGSVTLVVLKITERFSAASGSS
jgi:hypothetical protein